MLMEPSVMEQRYQAVRADICDGVPFVEVTRLNSASHAILAGLTYSGRGIADLRGLVCFRA